jgi:hypothetical protein
MTAGILKYVRFIIARNCTTSTVPLDIGIMAFRSLCSLKLLLVALQRLFSSVTVYRVPSAGQLLRTAKRRTSPAPAHRVLLNLLTCPFLIMCSASTLLTPAEGATRRSTLAGVQTRRAWQCQLRQQTGAYCDQYFKWINCGEWTGVQETSALMWRRVVGRRACYFRASLAGRAVGRT